MLRLVFVFDQCLFDIYNYFHTKNKFMGRKYAIHDPSDIYFVTFTVVNWVDIFTRDVYREIIIDSICFCQEKKGLEVFAYCMMTNHIHLIIRAKEGFNLSDIIRDLKSFTSRKIRKALESNNRESRREWMLYLFGSAGKFNKRNKDFQSINTKGLFPAGEGAGYAGGILSAGIDGIKVAEAVAKSMLKID